MRTKFSLDQAMSGLFPACVKCRSYPTFPDDDSVTIVIELGFEAEFDIEDRAEDCEQLCRRVRKEWAKFCEASPQFPEMQSMKLAVMLKFFVVPHDYRNN